MTYPSMRDADGTKPPYGSLEWWTRFLRVYGTSSCDLPAVRPDTADRARVREAVEAFRKSYPHLTVTGRIQRPTPPAGPGHM
jgi:hypothetical protein